MTVEKPSRATQKKFPKKRGRLEPDRYIVLYASTFMGLASAASRTALSITRPSSAEMLRRLLRRVADIFPFARGTRSAIVERFTH